MATREPLAPLTANTPRAGPERVLSPPAKITGISSQQPPATVSTAGTARVETESERQYALRLSHLHTLKKQLEAWEAR
jgi:hypothetical protein